MSETTAPKVKKAKGPIRIEAIGPIFIVVVLIWAYFYFFFDGNVRRALEYAGTQGNGAEVDIAHVHSSFWAASLEIDGIQVTSATEPTKNKLQIGKMHWQMLWDALLRGKVVINDASITDIAMGAPRAKPGRVLPPPPPAKESKEPSAAKKMEEEALARAKTEFDHNVLGDAAILLSGTDPTSQLKNVEGNLKSSARVKELQAGLTAKQKEWTDRIAKLPQAKELQALQDRVKGVKLDHFNNPAEVQQSLSQLDAIYKDANAKIQEVQATQSALNTDISTYQNSLQDLQKLVNEDIKDLEDRIKLPKLDVQTLSRTIFGPAVLAKVEQARFYMNKAREYMPPKKTATEKAEFKPPTAHEREKGRNYRFGHPNSYPLFWLKYAVLSSKSVPGAEYSGDLTGSIDNVTDDQPLIGKPTTASFKGDFPQRQIFGITGQVTFDHRTEKPIESLNLTIAKFAIPDRTLMDSPDVKMSLVNAVGQTQTDAEFEGESLKITSQNSFSRTSAAPAAALITSEAKQPVLDEILKSALKDVPKADLKATIAGQWTDPHFDIESNLGADLAHAFDKQLQAKVAEAKAKLQNLVNEQVGKQKDQLNAQFNQIKGQVDGLMKQKQDDVKKAQSSLDQAKNEAVKNQSRQLQDQGKKAVDDLKKQFGF